MSSYDSTSREERKEPIFAEQGVLWYLLKVRSPMKFTVFDGPWNDRLSNGKPSPNAGCQAVSFESRRSGWRQVGHLERDTGDAVAAWGSPVEMGYPPVIKHGVLENGPFISDLPIKTSMHRGFSVAMFDYQRVYIDFLNSNHFDGSVRVILWT